MLKRIKEIQGVGTYVECKAASVEFSHVNVIYGSNSYGKSTLCDVFRSIAENDVSLIRSRKSIPSAKSPKVSLSFVTAGSEAPVIFSDDQWQHTLPSSLRLAVFDSNFISRNLFTGVEVDRKNKEALTDFVLGERGVKQAERIAQMRKEYGQKQKDFKALEKAFAGIKDIANFIATKVDDDEDKLASQHEAAVKGLADKKQQVGNADKIVARAELNPLRFIKGAYTLSKKISDAAGTSLETIHDEVRRKLDHHLDLHIADPAKGREWIRFGVSLIKSDHCPFCGQYSGESATALYDIFQSSFDETYKAKLQETDALFKDALAKYQKYEGVEDAHLRQLETNSACLDAYPELLAQPDMEELASQLKVAAIDLREVVHKFVGVLTAEGAQLTSTIEQKRAAPHIAIPPQNLKHLMEIEDRLDEKASQYSVLVEDANALIAKFKCAVKSPSMVRDIATGEAEVRVELARLKRKQLDQTCEAYTRLSSAIVSLYDEIELEQSKLQVEQSVFLKTFFEKINYFFRKFGSRDFEIYTSKDMDAKGHLPVVSLNVRYKTKEIPLSQLGQVFSESDRRALALSIFWARLNIEDAASKANTIVVLDDPVTSFDEDRISTTMMEIESEAPVYCQLIFLTHYRKFVHQLLQNTTMGQKAILMCLLRTSTSGTTMKIEDKETFLHNDHHKKYLKIIGFIQGDHVSEIDKDLRVFLESEVHDRYRDAIHRNGFAKQQFKELVTSLQRAGILSDSVTARLDQLRKTLNEPHHQWSDRTPEDWSSLAEETVTFVYSTL